MPAALTTVNSLNPDALGPGPSFPTQSHANLATEQSMWKQTVPGGTFSSITSPVVRNYEIEAAGTLVNPGTGTHTLTLRGYANKAGGAKVKILEKALSFSQIASPVPVRLKMDLSVVAQSVSPVAYMGLVFFRDNVAPQLADSIGSGGASIAPWVVADDMDIEVTAQWNNVTGAPSLDLRPPTERIG